MQIETTFLPNEFYEKHLARISGIKFTQREIDIIAFTLSGRSSKSTANLLKISPRTVENHIRNIMLKLERNSREAIIDFAENSGKAPLIREYYLMLCANIEFIKCLASLNISTPLLCEIFYWPITGQGIHLIPYLLEHLKTANILSTSKIVKTDHINLETPQDASCNVWRVCFLPPPSLVQDSALIQYSSLDKVIWVISRHMVEETDVKEFTYMNFIHIDRLRDYYFLIFEILKRICPKTTNLEQKILEFEKKYTTLYDSYIPTSSQIDENQTISTKQFRIISRPTLQANKVRIIILLFVALTGSLWFVFKKEYSAINQETPEIAQCTNSTAVVRSSLIIPADSSLLNRQHLTEKLGVLFKEDKLPIQSVALIGIGGSGKTTLARHFAKLQQNSIIWEINAESKDSLITSFKLLAHALAKTEEEKTNLKRLEDIPNLNEKEERILQWVKDILRIRQDWLLVYENLEKYNDIQPFFPTDAESWGKGKVIITTRDHNIQQISHINHFIHLGELTSQERFDLFVKIMTNNGRNPFSSSEQKQVVDFLKVIPPFPLDVCCAAYYIKATHITYSDYLEHLRAHKQDFDVLQENVFKEVSGYAKTRFHILTLSLKQILETHPDFAALLLFVCLMDSENIPRTILDNYKNTVVVDNFIYNLKKFSLINPLVQNSANIGSTFSIHRSIQDICRVYLINTIDQRSDLMRSVGMSLKNELGKSIDNEDLPRMIILVNHAEAFLSHKRIIKDEIAKLISGYLSIIYFFIGDFIKAKMLIEYSLNSLKRSNPSELHQVAQLLSYAGIVARELGIYDEAKRLLNQSLELYNQKFPNDYTGRARVLLYLGMVARELGNFEESHEFLMHSYEIYRSKLPDNYAGIARTLGYLGIINRELGYYKEARKHLDQSILTYEKYIPNNKSGIAWALTHLGKVYKDIGKYEEAKQITEKALKLFQADLPDNQLAWVFVYLAGIYKEMELLKQAEAFLQKSQDIYRKTLPKDHVYHAWVLGQLGSLNRQLEKYQAAKDCCDEALSIYEKYYGKDHIENARLLNEMGHIALLDDRLGDAERLTKDALIIFEKKAHPERSLSFELLGKIYLKKSTLKELSKEERNKHKKQTTDYLKQAELIMKEHYPEASSHLKRIQATISKNLN